MTLQIDEPLSGEVVSLARLNIRGGDPSTTAPVIKKVESGTPLRVHGLISGERVSGNDQWYEGDDDSYFWSGACSSLGDDADDAGLSIPRRADGTIRPLRDADLRLAFGDIRHTEKEGGRVRLEDAWIEANLQSMDVDVLGQKITVHTKAVEPFRRVFAAIEEAGLGDRILTFDGTWVARHKGWNRERNLSAHAWGVAIDLNARWNGYGVRPAPRGEHGSLIELVPHFAAEGFAWGGHFRPSKYLDGMHFELARRDL